MKKATLFLCFCALMLSCFLATPVFAEESSDFPWRGGEIQLNLEGTLPVIQNVLSVDSRLVMFLAPENDVIQAFVYAGVKWHIFSWFWVRPMIGFTANGPSGDAFDLSLWTGSSIFNGFITVLSESDLLVNGDGEVDYYGSHSVDLHFGILNFGLQGEQFNKGYMFGPHIGIYKPLGNSIVASTELQYYLGFQDVNRGHTLRLLVGFSL